MRLAALKLAALLALAALAALAATLQITDRDRHMSQALPLPFALKMNRKRGDANAPLVPTLRKQLGAF